MIALYQHIIKYTNFSTDDFIKLIPFLDVITIPKKNKFIEYGQPLEYLYFVHKGLMYVQYEGAIGHNGIITTFVSENEWINNTFYDFESTGSIHEFVTIEKTTIIRILKSDMVKILTLLPALHFYFGKVQDYRIYKMDVGKISLAINKSSTRYELFKNGYAHLLHRIPLQLIAIYLNMKPETLSRSKKKLD